MGYFLAIVASNSDPDIIYAFVQGVVGLEFIPCMFEIKFSTDYLIVQYRGYYSNPSINKINYALFYNPSNNNHALYLGQVNSHPNF